MCHVQLVLFTTKSTKGSDNQNSELRALRITMLRNSRRLGKFFWPKDSGFRGLISGLRTHRCAERTLRIPSWPSCASWWRIVLFWLRFCRAGAFMVSS